MPAAIAVPVSGNTKIGPVAATSVSQVSCPSGCPFRNAGCYAEAGPQGTITRRLNDSPADHVAAAQEEAAAIDALPGSSALRLHVVGDCKDAQATRIVAAAAERYRERSGQAAVWTYTHAWPGVQRQAWGSVSVLASCEHTVDLAAAHARGYATALVVPALPKLSVPLPGGFRGVPCPEQAGKAANCLACRLCWSDARLREKRLTILFAAHGARAGKIRAHLAAMARAHAAAQQRLRQVGSAGVVPVSGRDLAPGTRLLGRYKGVRYTCTFGITEDGLPLYVLGDGRRFASASAAARAIKWDIPTNGWRFWRIAEQE